MINSVPQFSLVAVANVRDLIAMNTTAEEPLFHVILTERDQWAVEAEWPDGTLERVNTFKDYASAANWISAHSPTWVGVQRIFTE